MYVCIYITDLERDINTSKGRKKNQIDLIMETAKNVMVEQNR